MKDSKFLNEPSKKLYQFFQDKLDSKALTPQQIVDKLEVYQKNPASYFHALRSGTMSVKLEHILKAQAHFGLDPCDLFHDNRAVMNMAAEPQALYGKVDQLIDVIQQQQATINNLLNVSTDRRKNA